MSMEKCRELREVVLRELGEFDVQLKKLDMKEQSRRLEAKMEELKKGIFQVTFIGPFASGRKTTLNAILHRKVLPTSLHPGAPVFIRIVNGEDSPHVVISHRDGSPDTTVTLKQYQSVYGFETNMDDPGAFRDIHYVTMECKLPVDTVQFIYAPEIGAADTEERIHDCTCCSDGVVYVMHAYHLLTRDDREYLQRNFEKRHLKNLFFVVNGYNLVVKKEQPKLKAYVREQLKPVFEDEQGRFDEALYNQRVFFVDSYIAECFRTGDPYTVLTGNRETTIDVTEEDLEKSGVPELERKLMDFLASSDSDREGYISYLPILAGMYKESIKQVDAYSRMAKIGFKMGVSIEATDKNKDSMQAALAGMRGAINNLSLMLRYKPLSEQEILDMARE